MPFFSLRPSLVVLIGVITGCMLVLWTLRTVPAQTPEPEITEGELWILREAPVTA